MAKVKVDEVDAERIGEVVRALVDESGVTITALAERSKVCRAYIYALMKGEYNPTIETADMLLKPFGKKLVIK